MQHRRPWLRSIMLVLSATSLASCSQSFFPLVKPSPQATPTPPIPFPNIVQPAYGCPMPPDIPFGVFPSSPPFDLSTELILPSALAIRKDGTIALADLDQLVFLVNGTVSRSCPNLTDIADIEEDETGWIVANGDLLMRVEEGETALIAGGFSAPRGLAVASGSILVADTGKHQLKRVLPNGSVEILAGTGNAGFRDGKQADLKLPTRLVSDGDGTLYFCDTGNHAVRMLTKDGLVQTIAGDGQAGGFQDGLPRLNSPLGIALFEKRLYIADCGNHYVRVLDLETRELVSLGYNGVIDKNGNGQLFPELKDLAVQGNMLYVLDGKTIWRFRIK